jgi:hypothetical protein
MAISGASATGINSGSHSGRRFDWSVLLIFEKMRLVVWYLKVTKTQMVGGMVEKSSVLSPDERQIALSLLERLRDDLFKRPRLRDGKPLASASDIREYLTEQIDSIRTNGNTTPKA